MFGGVKEWRLGERGLVFLVLISLGLKVTLLLTGDVINIDGVRYIDAARQLAEGNFLEALSIEKMPFYSLLIVAVHFLIRDWVLAGQLISLFALVLALIPLYLLTKEIFDEKVAFWAGLAFALSPMFNAHAVDLIRDPIFLFFVAWSVYFFWRALTAPKCLFFVLASISSVLALLCRIEGVFLFAVFLLVLLVLAIRKAEERRSLLKGMTVLIGLPMVLGLLSGGALSLVAGIDLSSFSRLGEPMAHLQDAMNGDFLAMYHSLYAQLKSFKNPAALGTTGSFAETARRYIPLIYLLGAAEGLARNLFPIYVIPLLAGLGKRPAFHRGHWLILLVAGTYFLLAYYRLFTYDFISKRYVLVPALLLLPWVGRGLGRIWDGIAGCRWPRFAVCVFLLVFCAVPAYKSLGAFGGPGKGHVIREAGKWLTKQADLQNAVIVCSDPRIRFYSSQEMKFLRDMGSFHLVKDFRKMEKAAFDKKADLLIIEISKSKRRQIPEFKYFSLFKEFVGRRNDVLIYSRKI